MSEENQAAGPERNGAGVGQSAVAPNNFQVPPVSEGFSVYLDLLRFLAALTVLLSHASKSGIADKILPNLSQQGVDAVTIFFVLSGFVIYHTAVNKNPDLCDYVLARLARLWSVCLPALILSGLLAHIGMAHNPGIYNHLILKDELGRGLEKLISEFPSLRFIVGMLFLNEAWNISIIEYHNAPYWSLSYEFCYYMLFGFAFYLTGRSRIFFCCLTALIFGPKILLLLPVWLLGVGLYRYRPALNIALAWAFASLPLPLYLLANLANLEPRSWWFDQFLPFDPYWWSKHFVWHYLLGILVVMHLMGMRVLLGSHDLANVRKPIRWLAARTLSIYLFHFPILFFLAAVLPNGFWEREPIILGGTVVSVFALAQFTELRKGHWRKMLDWLTKRPRPGGAVSYCPFTAH